MPKTSRTQSNLRSHLNISLNSSSSRAHLCQIIKAQVHLLFSLNGGGNGDMLIFHPTTNGDDKPSQLKPTAPNGIIMGFV